MRRWVWLTLVLAHAAFAQRVVVLEFEGDKGNKLHTQVETALRKAGVVESVALSKWKDAAAKKKLKGPQAMTAAAVAKVARAAGVDAAVECTLSGNTAGFRILDEKGQELWSKELPTKKGLISDKHAGKLAKAIAAAAASAPHSAEAPAEEEEAAPVVVKKEEPKEEKAEAQPEETPAATGLSKAEREKRRKEEEAEASSAMTPIEPRPDERDVDLENEGKKTKAKVGPKVVRLWVAGTTTWRSYCSRPGVSSCAEYDAKEAAKRPPGDAVDFLPKVPYAGFNLNLELFPLAAITSSPAQGIGVVASFGMGFSLTKLVVSSPAGETPEKQVVSNDRTFSAQLAYRYYFGFGPERDPLVAYAGARFGVAGRNFEIDPNAMVPLPGSARLFPQLGLDGMVPLGSKYAKLVASFTFMISPKPGPDEIQGYGNFDAANGGATGAGISFDVGLAGDIWGPIGYEIRFRYAKFSDQYFGQGTKWTSPCDVSCGGAAEETYSALLWGVTASF